MRRHFNNCTELTTRESWINSLTLRIWKYVPRFSEANQITSKYNRNNVWETFYLSKRIFGKFPFQFNKFHLAMCCLLQLELKAIHDLLYLLHLISIDISKFNLSRSKLICNNYIKNVKTSQLYWRIFCTGFQYFAGQVYISFIL